MKTKLLLVMAMMAFMVPATQAGTGRIKLTALPERERVEIQLDNGQATLVEEERIVPLLKSTSETGNNMIDFSWSNTAIDKNSIQFRPIAIRENDKFRAIKNVAVGGKEVAEVNVINVAYPPNENALVWEIYSLEAAAVKVRVSYLISNLTRSFDYRALANHDETLLTLKNYLLVRNYSGEDFGASGVWAGFGEKFQKIVSQQEDIKMLMHSFPEVPIEKVFTFDWYAHGQLNADKPFASKVLMYYKLINDEKHALGLFPLQPGKVRIFIEDGHAGEAFLGEDWAGLTPLDGFMKLFIGEARDVVCTRTIEKNDSHPIRHNLHDQEIVIKYEIENFKEKACTLRITEDLNRLAMQFSGDPHGDVEWEKGSQTSDAIAFSNEEGGARPILSVTLPARPKDKNAKVEKMTVRFHLTLKNLW